MKRLARDRDGDGKTDLWGSTLDITWDRIQMHVNGWGGHLVDPTDPKKTLMCEPKAMAAQEWIRARMWDDRVLATFLDVENVSTRQALITQRVAMVEDGSWALKDILTEAQFRLGVAPFPAGPVRRVTLATTDGYGIYAGTKHSEAAWELLKFLIGKDYGRAMARANYLQPARASLVADWVEYIKKEFPEKTQDVDIAAFADGQIKGYSVTAEILHNMGEAKEIAKTAWTEVFTLGQASLERLTEACRQIQEAQQ
jgi:multiple sugar transport system substrate-binding protein